jgi:hypothetical protein
VSTNRFLVLVIGPVILIAGCYWVTFEFPRDAREVMAATTMVDPSPAHFNLGPSSNPDLEEDCNKTAAALILRMGEQYRVVVESPFVIAGDMPEADLRQHFATTISPILHALQSSYFETAPNQPITVVMLTTVRNYRRTARELDDYNATHYHGYFRRDKRRIVLDLSSGNGTLAHELTHALFAFDFPAGPEWFDEGLASLHEQGEFSEDGKTLLGHHNWRLQSLKQAMLMRQLKPIEELIGARTFRQEGEGLQYAHVRYFCLYLQRRGLLKEYYRQFRAAVSNDPDGLATLQKVLGVDSMDEIDADFHIWLRNEFHAIDRFAG